MKIEQLNETPLPDDWDHDIYDERTSFAKRIRYATEKAQKLGAGSARVAFKVPYQGRDTVLKIAKNRKGAAQNEYEAEILGDYFIGSYDILIPMIDYDEKNSYPTWIHTEYAKKAKKSDFRRIAGASLEEIVKAAVYYSGQGWKFPMYKHLKEEDLVVDQENDYVDGLVQLLGNYDHPVGDYERISSWGIYRNRLVIVDAGLSNEVFKTYYS